jgi:phosphoribosylaminoimidazole (AIR) synthetase
MGMGFCLVVDKDVSDAVRKALRGASAKRVGYIGTGTGVDLKGSGIQFDGYI